MAYNDVENMRRYRREWYHRNKDFAKAKRAEQKSRIKEWLEEFKRGLKCSECPEDHPATLDFHHLEPDGKDIGVSQAITDGWSIARIKSEMAKCKVLCSNCHRKLHHSLGDRGRHRRLESNQPAMVLETMPRPAPADLLAD
ncbi:MULTISPECIES: hypothetical protein [unclassified Bradyrhizobium]|uniref:hypothetical protein n=1 Tax=Bradyrhizobium sp. USDA 4541 TaxID=2817704 RepID=UPI0020A33D10|nr:hypothetical protein [Bradyrhizobium sp. USDA 4541]MCP1852737.1 hypothetical protein [Bradyrhizobium sp. USDA 4541]